MATIVKDSFLYAGDYSGMTLGEIGGIQRIFVTLLMMEPMQKSPSRISSQVMLCAKGDMSCWLNPFQHRPAE